MGCQTSAAWEEEAILAPPRVAGWEPLTDSWITIPPEGRGGVLAGALLTTLGGWLSMRCFFFCQSDWGGRRRSTVLGSGLLRLARRLGVEQKFVDSELPPHNHFRLLIILSYFLLGCLGLAFVPFNRNMSLLLKSLGNLFG